MDLFVCHLDQNQFDFSIPMLFLRPALFILLFVWVFFFKYEPFKMGVDLQSDINTVLNFNGANFLLTVPAKSGIVIVMR